MSEQYATNQEIDDAVLYAIDVRTSATNMILGGVIGSKLNLRPSKSKRAIPEHWRAHDLASASCQRLKKKGFIRFVPGTGWIITSYYKSNK